MGLISLPGAMTGMLMGGTSPLEAIQLQIVIMNMLIGASAISSTISTYLSWPSFFTKAYQLETKVFAPWAKLNIYIIAKTPILDVPPTIKMQGQKNLK